jgi:Tol biopolymer transport system component/DNA-binding winged helix-turn-helix (wHTH) protein
VNYRFGEFELDPVRRSLSKDGKAIALKPKVFETLLVLVRNSGRVMDKDELMGQVWPDTVVEEVNLAHNISVLRKALGQRSDENRFIITVPGRGYGFVAEVTRNQRNAPAASAVSEYELTRSHFVVEEETGETDLSDASRPYTAEADTRRTHLTGRLLPETTGRGFQHRRFILLLSGGLIVLLVLSGGFLVWRYYSQRARRGNSDAIPYAEAKIKQLTTKGTVRWAVLSRDGKFYAYTLTERDGGKESLWLGQTDGGNDLELRPPDDIVYNGLAFSPDDKTIYFTVNGGAQSQNGFFKLPLLGGVAEKLSNDVKAQFALSSDGKQIAFFRTNKETESTAVVIANLDGTGMRELVTRPMDKPFGLCADWSPDGSLLAVSAAGDSTKESREVFVVRVADGHLEQLSAFEWIRISNLVWTPDARGLILVAQDKREGFRSLWHVDHRTGDARRLSRDTDGYGAALSLSADGNSLLATQVRRESNIWIAPAGDLAAARQVTFSSINGLYGYYGFDWTPDDRIVFSAGIDRALAIYSMDLNGGQTRQLTSGGFSDQTPNVTADGRFIVFQSNRGGSSEIWRAGLDGSDLRQLTTGGGDHSPHTTPDGKWVVYVSTRDGKSFVWRIPIEGGESVRLTDKESSNPRVSPDGTLIACSYRADPKSAGQLALLKTEDGAPVKLFDVPRSARFNDSIRWTPDGKAVCYRDNINGIWRQAIDGGEPQRLAGLPEEASFRYGWSRDGKHFAFARGRALADAVLITNAK